VSALLRVIADLQEELFHTYGMSALDLQKVFFRAGISREVFEEFDLSDLEMGI